MPVYLLVMVPSRDMLFKSSQMERKCILVSKALWNVKVEKKIRAPKHPVRRFIRFRHRLGEPDIALMTQ